MSVTSEIIQAIRRNPKINKVIVSRAEFETMRDEARELSLRTLGPINIIAILGVPVEIRA